MYRMPGRGPRTPHAANSHKETNTTPHHTNPYLRVYTNTPQSNAKIWPHAVFTFMTVSLRSLSRSLCRSPACRSGFLRVCVLCCCCRCCLRCDAMCVCTYSKCASPVCAGASCALVCVCACVKHDPKHPSAAESSAESAKPEWCTHA